MNTFWITVDGFRVAKHITPFELNDAAQEKVLYTYAKEHGISLKGVKMRIDLAQTEQDFPIYKMRQG